MSTSGAGEILIREPKSLPVQSFEDTFFQKPLVDLRNERARYHRFLPDRPLIPGRDKEISVDIPAWKGRSYFNMNALYCRAVVQCVQKLDFKTPPPENTQLSFVNNILPSMFKKRALFVQDKEINSYQDDAHYIDYIEDTLGNSREVKLDLLQSLQGYAKDTPGKFDTMSQDNKGWTRRWKYFAGLTGEDEASKKQKMIWNEDGCEMFMELKTDLSTSGIQLPPGTRMQIKFELNPPGKLLLPGVNIQPATAVNPDLYALVITQLEILIRVDELEAKIHERLMSRWRNDMNMSWNFKRRCLFAKFIPEGRKVEKISHPWPNPNMIPSRMIVSFVYAHAYDGTFQQAEPADPKKYFNMYNFLRYFGDPDEAGRPENEIQSAKLTINSVELDGLAGSSAVGEFFRTQVLQHSYVDRVEQDLDLNDYISGYGYWIFDLTNNLNASQQYITPAIRDGTYQLEVGFKNITKQALYCLMYCEYPSTLEMSPNFQLSGNFELAGQR